MATTFVMPDSKVKEMVIDVAAPKTGGVSLVSAMLFLVGVASVWAAVVVGFHFLELYVLGTH